MESRVTFLFVFKVKNQYNGIAEVNIIEVQVSVILAYSLRAGWN